MMRSVQSADVPPTSTEAAIIAQKRKALGELLQRWKAIQSADLASLNQQLGKANLPELAVDKNAGAAGVDYDDDNDDIG
jgi:hypothetical protein